MTTFMTPAMTAEPFDLSGRTLTLPAGSVGAAALAAGSVGGAALAAGANVQSQSTITGAMSTGTAIIPRDDTIPQVGEGTEFLSRSITPLSATNILQVDVVLHASCSVTSDIVAALFRDGGANALAVGSVYATTSLGVMQIVLRHRVVASSTAATTFTVRAGPITAGTVTVNGASGGRYYGGVFASSISITEVKA